MMVANMCPGRNRRLHDFIGMLGALPRCRIETQSSESRDKFIKSSTLKAARQRNLEPQTRGEQSINEQFSKASQPISPFPVIYLKQSKCIEAETVIRTFWLDCDSRCFHPALLAMLYWPHFKAPGSLALLLLFWNYDFCQAKLHYFKRSLLIFFITLWPELCKYLHLCSWNTC